MSSRNSHTQWEWYIVYSTAISTHLVVCVGKGSSKRCVEDGSSIDRYIPKCDNSSSAVSSVWTFFSLLFFSAFLLVMEWKSSFGLVCWKERGKKKRTRCRKKKREIDLVCELRCRRLLRDIPLKALSWFRFLPPMQPVSWERSQFKMVVRAVTAVAAAAAEEEERENCVCLS